MTKREGSVEGLGWANGTFNKYGKVNGLLPPFFPSSSRSFYFFPFPFLWNVMFQPELGRGVWWGTGTKF